MSQPTPAPDLLAHTGNRMAEVAADSARGMVERRLRGFVKSYVPRMFWPLIPGEGGSVADNAKAGASKWFWGVVTSAIVSVLFFLVFAAAVVGFVGITVFAVLFG